jgi:hypothetical protein
VVIFRDGEGAILSRGMLRGDGRLVLTCEAGDTELDSECTPITRAGVCQPGICR